jgi:hypothetical protein
MQQMSETLSLIFNPTMPGRARLCSSFGVSLTTGRGHRLILFGFLSQNIEDGAVAAVVSVAQAGIQGEGATRTGRGDLARFRQEFYTSLALRADALFELTDAVLCAQGPVRSLVELTLVAEHRRGHGAMYDALNQGWVEPERIRRSLSSLPLPKTTDGRLVLAVDVSPWAALGRCDQRGAAVLPCPWPREGPGPVDPGLAVLLRRRAGAWPHFLDCHARRDPPAPRR